MIELLIALVMVAVIGASLYSSMYTAFRSQRASETVVEPGRTADLAMETVMNDIQNALPPDTNEDNALPGNFEGAQAQDDRGHEGDDIQFFTTNDARQHLDSNGEVKGVELTVQTDTNGDHVLVRKVTRNLLPPEGATPITDEEVLCRGVWSFTCQYFNGTVWEPTWDSTALDNTLPVAVQITMQLQRPGGTTGTQTLSFTRTFTLPCSTAAQDPNAQD